MGFGSTGKRKVTGFEVDPPRGEVMPAHKTDVRKIVRDIEAISFDQGSSLEQIEWAKDLDNSPITVQANQTQEVSLSLRSISLPEEDIGFTIVKMFNQEGELIDACVIGVEIEKNRRSSFHQRQWNQPFYKAKSSKWKHRNGNSIWECSIRCPYRL